MIPRMRSMGLDYPRLTASDIADLAALLAAAGPANGAQSSGPQWVLPGDPGRGSVVVDEKRCRSCHTVNGRGAGSAPELVPGSMLVFESERHNTWDVFSANDDGTNQQRLTTHNAPELHPRANRGYTRIAFASNRDTDNYNIFTMNPDGSGLVQLMTTATQAAQTGKVLSLT